jgi:hypothetical protein
MAGNGPIVRSKPAIRRTRQQSALSGSQARSEQRVCQRVKHRPRLAVVELSRVFPPKLPSVSVRTLRDPFRHEIRTERFRAITPSWIRRRRESQRFPKLNDPERQKLRYLQGFPRSACWQDGWPPTWPDIGTSHRSETRRERSGRQRCTPERALGSLRICRKQASSWRGFGASALVRLYVRDSRRQSY